LAGSSAAGSVSRRCMITVGRRRLPPFTRRRRDIRFPRSEEVRMLTQRLAEFVIETRASDVPSEVMDASRDALIDTLGVGVVGSLEEVGEIALRYVSGMEARREASIWGTHVATTMAEAAFVNGILGHALDFDDVHASVHGHPSTTIIPSVGRAHV